MYMGRACAITSYEVQAKQSIICSITVQAILLTFSCRLMSPVSLYLVRTVILKYRPLGCSGINFGKINGFFQLTTHIHVSLSQMWATGSISQQVTTTLGLALQFFSVQILGESLGLRAIYISPYMTTFDPECGYIYVIYTFVCFLKTTVIYVDEIYTDWQRV
jgi:hypothetical protein